MEKYIRAVQKQNTRKIVEERTDESPTDVITDLFEKDFDDCNSLFNELVNFMFDPHFSYNYP